LGCNKRYSEVIFNVQQDPGVAGISIDQFVAAAVAEKMASLMTEEYLEERARRGSGARYKAALKLVPDVDPVAYDRLPEP
jgi:hypothetical protein